MTNIVRNFVAAVTGVLLLCVALSASGPVGIYGIVERVVFEPSEQSPERMQLWGAFVYVDGGIGSLTTSGAKRGYLYFRMPDYTAAGAPASAETRETVRREWMDLKNIAGTGQTVGFGSWQYTGTFARLDPSLHNRSEPPHIYERLPRGVTFTDIRVRDASEQPDSPAAYQTNAGIVKIPAEGNFAILVRELRIAPAAK